VAGIVESVGPNVTHVKKGDRVFSWLAWAMFLQPKYGGFQDYSVGLAPTTTKIPYSLSFDEAATFPLGIATAAVRLFIGLELEKLTLSTPKGACHILEALGEGSAEPTTQPKFTSHF